MIILTKFHGDRKKNVDFFVMVNFCLCLVFYSSDFSKQQFVDSFSLALRLPTQNGTNIKSTRTLLFHQLYHVDPKISRTKQKTRWYSWTKKNIRKSSSRASFEAVVLSKLNFACRCQSKRIRTRKERNRKKGNGQLPSDIKEWAFLKYSYFSQSEQNFVKVNGTLLQ